MDANNTDTDGADTVDSSRPRPLRDEATLLVKLLGVGGSLALALIGWGVLTAVQGNALVGLLGAIPGLVNAITTVLTAFGLVSRVEPLVTPISAPQNNAGQDLRPPSPPGDFGSGYGRYDTDVDG